MTSRHVAARNASTSGVARSRRCGEERTDLTSKKCAVNRGALPGGEKRREVRGGTMGGEEDGGWRMAREREAAGRRGG